MTLSEIVEQLRSCGYVCEAGPLELNTAFIELERLSKLQDDKREALAAYAHEAWSGWMAYMFEHGGMDTMQVDDNGKTLVFWTMKPEKYERWQRQASTPYADLPESEKASDRAEADKMLAIMGK